MKLINQSAEYLPQQAGIDGIYKQIELAGRTSYLSWDKMVDVISIDLGTLPGNIKASDIPDYKLSPQTCIKFLDDNKIKYQIINSSKKFVDMLIKSKHHSVLEHGTIYLMQPLQYDTTYTGGQMGSWDLKLKKNIFNKYNTNPYSKAIRRKTGNAIPSGNNYITTNLRVLQENGWLDDLKYLCEPTEFHEKRLSVKVVTDIGITREFNRHRAFSIVEQSTRYCNFSKDKFGNEITFVIPVWFEDILPEGYYEMKATCFECNGKRIDMNHMKSVRPFLYLLHCSEDMYFRAIEYQDMPQQARQVLPLSVKTEVVYTAFESDWRHFFDLRLFGKTGESHPQMKQLAELIKQEFEKAGVLEGIMKYPSKFE